MYDFSFRDFATSNVDSIPEFHKILAVPICMVNGSGSSHTALAVGSVLELNP
jgi:hypothetical protein